MSKFFHVLIMLVIFISPAFAEDGKLVVNVTDLDGSGGFVEMGLYNNPSVWPERGKSFLKSKIEVKGKSLSYIFENVPVPGEYALAIFHDANSNGKIDKNFLGIPKEGYAFSNDARGVFGPPDFEDASFKMEGDKEITIKMGY